MAGRNYDVIVAGVGGMGSAAAYALARRGRKVLGLEQFPLVHDRGSSHGQTRIIRKAYFEHPNYVPLVQRAYQLWRELEQASGRNLLTECGCLNIGKEHSELITGVRRAAAEHHLPVENLSSSELRQRFGKLRFDDSYVAVLEKEAGYLYVEDCVRTHIEQATKLGADFREREPIVGWKADDKGVEVQTNFGVYRAERLVVTAGAWTRTMLTDLGLPLTVRRKALLWFGTTDDQAFRRDVFPIYLTNAQGGFYYGFPVIDGLGHKAARHDLGDVVDDPARVNRELQPEDELDVCRFLREHLPDAAGPLLSCKICLYTMTPDEHFVIDVHPHYPRVVLAGGFSGHGFKFAASVGEILADLAEKEQTEWRIDMFRMGRFSQAVP